MFGKKEKSMETRSFGEREDPVTGSIESKTAKMPSVAYLGLAVGAMAVSAIAKLSGRDNLALFIGQWAPTLLIIGTYNKLVKLGGSDAYSGTSQTRKAA
jgi:hypothetical protein